MNEEQKEKKCNAIRDFRYSLIAELCNPYLPAGQLKHLIKYKASLNHDIPYSGRTKICEATIKNWLYLFKNCGKDALSPKIRDDFGKSRSISKEDADIIVKYLEDHPHVTALSALKYLKSENKVSYDISSSSLFRLLESYGLSLKERSALKEEPEQKLKFNFFYPLECVQADCMYAFNIPDSKGRLRKAILIAFIDDATRRILYADFTFTEQSLMFEKGIKHILKTHGKITKLYADNGSTFISNQTKRIIDILGIILVHSRPYKPAGRGKIERFFRTLRNQFLDILDKDKIKSIEDLNTKLHIWLETEYHRNPHKGLDNNTPLDAWLEKTKYLISVDKSVDIDKIFLHEISRKVYKDATITLDGSLYEIPSVLIGKTIRAFYDPFLPVRKLQIFHNNIFYGEANPVDSYANTRIIRNYNTKALETSSVSNDTKNENIKEHFNHSIKSLLNAAKIDMEDNNG